MWPVWAVLARVCCSVLDGQHASLFVLVVFAVCGGCSDDTLSSGLCEGSVCVCCGIESSVVAGGRVWGGVEGNVPAEGGGCVGPGAVAVARSELEWVVVAGDCCC